MIGQIVDLLKRGWNVTFPASHNSRPFQVNISKDGQLHSAFWWQEYELQRGLESLIRRASLSQPAMQAACDSVAKNLLKHLNAIPEGTCEEKEKLVSNIIFIALMDDQGELARGERNV